MSNPSHLPVDAAPRRRKSPRIAIVGAGRLGTALGLALIRADLNVAAVVCRHSTNAKRAARLIGKKVVALSAKQLDRLPEVDIAIISTPDDLIASAATSLAELKRSSIATVLHVSGSLPSSVLRPLFPRKIGIGSMHPLLAVSDPAVGADALRSAAFCIEGEAIALRVARQLVTSLGAEVFTIKTEHKTLYHAAAVMAAGHVVTLFDLAARVLEQCGPSRPESERLLSALFLSATADLGNRETAELLTGPFARGDAKTVAQHVTALETAPVADALAVYRALGSHAITLARMLRIDRRAAQRLQNALALPPSSEE